MWVSSAELPKSPGHVFYRRLNGLLAEAGFDRFVEELCEPHYASGKGRPGIPPGVYFRMLLVGYFEGITSQRGIAWRCADSLSLRDFLGLPLTEDAPDHSSLTRIRERLPLEVHQRVFQFVLQMAAQQKLIDGKTVAVDSTTLEASAAMKSIVRRDTGEDWNEYLTRLMREEGVIGKDEEPTDEERRRFDKNRTDKKVSNEDWRSPTDPASRIAKMKDGTTHLAYKAENVVDLKTDFILAAEVYRADQSDTNTLVDSVVQAQTHLNEAGVEVTLQEVVADKGYHAAETLELAQSLSYRTYIPEPQHAHERRWTDKPAEYQAAVYANRRRVKRAKGKRLQRSRSEMTERTFAHLCETGGARRTWLRGLEKVQKRWILHATARNLGRILRKLFNMGTARGLQAEGGLALLLSLACLITATLLTLQRQLQAAFKATLRPQRNSHYCWA
jgi:transposase